MENVGPVTTIVLNILHRWDRLISNKVSRIRSNPASFERLLLYRQIGIYLEACAAALRRILDAFDTNKVSRLQ
jgi:hypothetical protein